VPSFVTGARLPTLFLTVVAALAAVSPRTARAQDTPGPFPEPPPSLSLEQALELARRNNPTFLSTANDETVAEWNVRAAYGALVPSASASGSLGWQGTGDQLLGGNLTLGDLGVGNQPNYYSSNYSLGFNYNLSGSTLLEPSRAKAQRRSTTAQVGLARVNLDAEVTRLYLDVLRQKEEVELVTQQLERARFNLRLAQGQSEVGQATAVDVTQAEIQVGRSEVSLLRTRNAVTTATFRLFQQLGVALRPEVELTTEFPVTEPVWSEDELLDMAYAGNPTLASRRHAREAARIGVRAARTSYLPSLSLSMGWSGFTREASSTDFPIAQARAQAESRIQSCQATNELYSRLADPLPLQDCSRFAFSDEQRTSIIQANDVFPFDFTQSPPTARLSISVPIFQGLSRQRQVEQAQAAMDDAEYQLREQELALRADVAINLAQVRTAFRSVELEERNQIFADDQLRLARERYRAGLIPFLDLVEAETVKVQADRDLLAAIYAFHDALTTLDAVVGGRLRTP
jgi:outer membrane protein